jgi:hypothetical protein
MAAFPPVMNSPSARRQGAICVTDQEKFAPLVEDLPRPIHQKMAAKFERRF